MTSRLLVVLAFTTAFCSMTPLRAAGSDGPTRVIPSQFVTADGDRIEIHLSPDKLKRPGFVEVCLHNRTGTHDRLGFDLASVEKPRYLTTTTDMVCGRFAPTRQNFNLWKGQAIPNGVPVLRVQLDMARYSGGWIDMYWLTSGP